MTSRNDLDVENYLAEFDDNYKELPSLSSHEIFLNSVMKDLIRKKWIANGHGKLSTINNKMEFLAAAKNSQELVLYCYCPPNLYHERDEEMLNVLSKKHLETKFCKADMSKAYCLYKYLKVKILPAIVLFRESKPIAYITCYEDYNIDELEWRISKSGIIDYEENLEDSFLEYEPPEYSESVGSFMKWLYKL